MVFELANYYDKLFLRGTPMKFPGGFNIQQMMKQAQVMQEKMQKEMEELRVDASATGAGRVGLRWRAAATLRAARGHLLKAAQALQLLLASGEDERVAAQMAAQLYVLVRKHGHNCIDDHGQTLTKPEIRAHRHPPGRVIV